MSIIYFIIIQDIDMFQKKLQEMLFNVVIMLFLLLFDKCYVVFINIVYLKFMLLVECLMFEFYCYLCEFLL